jgi:hypothetical protein
MAWNEQEACFLIGTIIVWLLQLAVSKNVHVDWLSQLILLGPCD